MWIKHTYEYSKLTELSTVWKSRIVQNEVYIREKRLSFNTKKQCANNALCFPDVYARQDFILVSCYLLRVRNLLIEVHLVHCPLFCLVAAFLAMVVKCRLKAF